METEINEPVEASSLIPLALAVAAFASEPIPIEKRLLAKKYIIEAQRDLRRANLLYKDNDYPGAIYHLQQSVEKLHKAAGHGIFRLGDGFEKQASHDSHQVFGKIFEEEWVKSTLTLMHDVNPQINLPTTEFDKISKDRLKIAKEKKEEIEKLLDIIDFIETMFDKEETREKLALLSILENSEETQDLNSDEGGQKIRNDLPQKLGIFVTAIIRLFILGAITFPHEAYTRYPDGEMTPDDYTPELGIVQVLPRILIKQEDTIKIIEEILGRGPKELPSESTSA